LAQKPSLPHDATTQGERAMRPAFGVAKRQQLGSLVSNAKPFAEEALDSFAVFPVPYNFQRIPT